MPQHPLLLPRPTGPAATAVALALALIAALPAAAEPSSLFVDRVDVNVVNVEVFVTDKDGRRVPGLALGDFEIREDGKPVEISNFFAFDRGDTVLRNLEADRRLVLGQTPPAAPAAVPEDQRLNLLIYVDHFNLSPQSKARVLEQLEGFAEDRLLQGDNLSLIGYNRRLHVVQPFTRDRAAIERGLAELRKLSTNRQIDEAERRRTMLAMRTGFPDFTAGYSMLRSYVEKARSEVRGSTEALASVVRSLAGLPGRRAILYVSEGLPMRPGEDLYRYFDDLYGKTILAPQVASAGIDPVIESIAQNEKALFDSVSRHANAHQVTFYTLDARGPGGTRALAADQGDLSVTASGPRQLDLIRHQGMQEPLIEMAVSTGGAAVLETFSFENALGKMAGDFDAFYSLGYRSRRGGDGKFHKITVRVLKPGLKVRHREGYVDKPESERVADRTLSSLLLDLEANPLNVALDFGRAERKGRNEYHLPVLVRIPFREVTLLPNGDSEEARLKIFLVVRDEDGDLSKLQEIPYPITVPHAQVAEARDREIGWSTTLAIRPGVPTVAIGVWDELSGVESYIQKKVVVDAKRGGETQGR